VKSVNNDNILKAGSTVYARKNPVVEPDDDIFDA
jgi:hypothetical protein